MSSAKKTKSMLSTTRDRRTGAGLTIPKDKAETSGYATWFTAGGAIRIAHYDVIDDIITRKL